MNKRLQVAVKIIQNGDKIVRPPWGLSPEDPKGQRWLDLKSLMPDIVAAGKGRHGTALFAGVLFKVIRHVSLNADFSA